MKKKKSTLGNSIAIICGMVSILTSAVYTALYFHEEFSSIDKRVALLESYHQSEHQTMTDNFKTIDSKIDKIYYILSTRSA